MLPHRRSVLHFAAEPQEFFAVNSLKSNITHFTFLFFFQIVLL